MDRADCSPQCAWASSHQLKLGLEQKAPPAPPLQVEVNCSYLPDCPCDFHIRHWCISCFGFELNMHASWILRLLAFRLQPHLWLSPDSPVHQQPLQTLGLVSLHNHMSQFVIPNLFLYIPAPHWLCFSGETWLVYSSAHSNLFCPPHTPFPCAQCINT